MRVMYYVRRTMAARMSTDATPLIGDRAYSELRDRIVTLRLPPGSVLREEELMAELDLGRTPLRDALRRLSLESLVSVEPRRATTVTAVDASDIVHISEVRAELEAQAAELAALRVDGVLRTECETLAGELDRLERTRDQDALMRLDERIHRTVWRAAQNPYLTTTLERYFTLSLRIWYVVLDRVPGLGGAVHDQGPLLRAILDHDGTTARRLMRDHVLEFHREILAAYSRG
jgi:DNA-binding GntR family transcriptional regulator